MPVRPEMTVTVASEVGVAGLNRIVVREAVSPAVVKMRLSVDRNAAACASVMVSKM